MPKLRDWVADVGVATQTWRGPACWGVGAAVLLWVVWYFTKAPCNMANAEAGLCNAGAIARLINHQILAQCILLGLAVSAVKGGYNEIMVSRERKRADAAEQRADEAEERLRQERKRVDEKIAEIQAERDRLLDEREAELERREAERQAELERREAERQAELERREAERQAELERREAERELDRAERQSILNTMVRINSTLAQLVANQQNGQSSSEK